MQSLTWNANTENLGNSRRTVVHSKWINYLADDWKSIDLSPRQVAGRFRFNRSPYDLECPKTANGDFRFDANCKWDIHNKCLINSSAAGFTKRFPGALEVPAIVDGHNVRYPLASPDIGANILICPHEQHVKLCYEWLGKPHGTSKYIKCPVSFDFDEIPELTRKTGNRDIATKYTELNEPLTHRFSGMRGVTIKRAKVWDSLGRQTQVSLQLRRQGRRLVGVKLVPRHFLDQAFQDGAAWVLTDTTTTIFPNAHPESTSVDGRVGAVGEDVSFASLRGHAGNSVDDSANIFFARIHADLGNYQAIMRGITVFDVSAIPDSDEISSATESLYINFKEGDAGDQSLGLFAGTTASNTALASTDYGSNVGNTTPYANAIDVTGISVGAYMDMPLIAAGLTALGSAVTGSNIFKTCQRLSGDTNNSDPGLAGSGSIADVTFRSAEQASTTFDPKLTIEHEEAASVGLSQYFRLYKTEYCWLNAFDKRFDIDLTNRRN